MKRFPPRPSRGLVTGAVLVAALWANSIPPAAAQSPSGRPAAATDGVANDSGQTRPTVESAARDAQEAIKACGDDVALQCVAAELTRYAEALRQIAEERGQESPSVSQRRHALCLSRRHRPIPCRG